MKKSIRTTAGLFVGGETDFDVSFSESDQGETSLSVANVGNNMAYSVKVSIPDQDGYKVSGSSSTIVGNLEKGDYTIASFNIASTQQDAKNAESSSENIKSSDKGENVTFDSMDSNPLKVQIEYTDAKGERITVDKEVKLEMNSGNMTVQGSGGPGNKSSGFGSYLSYIVIIALVGGAFVYRKKIQEKLMGRKKEVIRKKT
ncbi:COG1361 family protein [Methanosarcina barkeri]|uniref:hypothetical protein n=1 Tax=Methanosarcina barkeri TaxID=2208 RepID=UPI001FB5244B|nr:hypothetical protein [Methanosarcina barkeri]